MSDYRQIGTCAVDSGQIMIVDPCYVANNRYTDKEYCATIEVTCADTGPQCGPDLGGLAVSTTTGVGDGVFPVYGTFDGDTLVSMEIKFTDDSEDNECNRCADKAEPGEDYCWRCAEDDEDEEEEEED